MDQQLRVYIPNLDGGERLRRTLRSLALQTRPAPVVVVDNASRDGSPDVAEREFGATVVRLARNVGFGTALNLGVRARPADLVVFVNNDVECEPQFLEALCEAWRPGTMVAGVLLQHASPGLIDSAGVAADETLLAWDYLHGRPASEAAEAAAPLGPTGGAALFERAAFERAGRFDERIFAYLEDVDLALRLRLAGARCTLSPDARAVHRHSSTLGSGSPRKNRLMGWSRGYLLRRYGVMHDARLVLPTLAREITIAGGQLLVDRNATGVAGRLRGWSAAAGLPRRTIPPGSLLQVSTVEALRRRRLRRQKHPG